MPERRLKQFRTKQASLWQSAVDRVVGGAPLASPAAGFGDEVAAPPVGRVPPQTTEAAASYAAADEIATLLDQGAVPEIPAEPSPAAGFADAGCILLEAGSAHRASPGEIHLHERHHRVKGATGTVGTKFGGCDPQWVQVIAEYVKSLAGSVHIPYRVYNTLDDFVISGPRFPDNGKIAILGDWGTGQDAARGVLRQIAAKNPDVVIHLGDVYYSGTDHEFQQYFCPIWADTLGLPKVAWGGRPTDLNARPSTFTLSGNHDMYAGGAPYYTVLDMIGQPASYFCLRNANW